jgi:hypothetical protein
MNFNKPINDPQNYYWYKQGFSKGPESYYLRRGLFR